MQPTAGTDAPPLTPILPDTTSLARKVARRYRYPPPGIGRDDLVQEAELAILSALPRYDPATCGDLPAYLYMRARGRLSALLRKAQRRAAREVQLAVDVPAPPRPEEPEELPPMPDLRCLSGRQQDVI